MFEYAASMFIELYTMTYTAGGGRCTEVVLYSLVEPYQTRSDVIRIVFSLLMSPSLGGLGRPPAVRWKLAKTP